MHIFQVMASIFKMKEWFSFSYSFFVWLLPHYIRVSNLFCILLPPAIFILVLRDRKYTFRNEIVLIYRTLYCKHSASDFWKNKKLIDIKTSPFCRRPFLRDKQFSCRWPFKWGDNSNLTNYNFMFWLMYQKLLPTQRLKMFLPFKTNVEYEIKIKIVCHFTIFNW